MNYSSRIERNPGTMLGKPCIKGTRLTVQLILEHLAYQPIEDLLESYPQLTREDIQAALLYSANELGSKMVMDRVESAA